MVMDFAILEKLARRETGRARASDREQRPGRLVVIPSGLKYRRALLSIQPPSPVDTFVLEYDDFPTPAYGGLTGFMKYLAGLARMLPVCSRLDFVLVSDSRVRPSILAALTAARLLGVSIHLHDYRFRSARGEKLAGLVYPLCDRLELGDTAAIPDGAALPSILTFRLETCDCEAYGKFIKDKAVPKVVVYGDLESGRIISLIRRTHELIKQKYPRTEFILASMAGQDQQLNGRNVFDPSVKIVGIGSEAGFRACFEEADSVLLLSPGGLNRCFMIRARAAGYPVITNGFDYSEYEKATISVTRDSYSGLADAVIRLVDDDVHYRSFVSR